MKPTGELAILPAWRRARIVPRGNDHALLQASDLRKGVIQREVPEVAEEQPKTVYEKVRITNRIRLNDRTVSYSFHWIKRLVK